MLFTQLNGLASQPAESRAEIDVLQDLACRIGPRVDGINASRSLPQAMGAFVTSGAQGACVGREQQSEQHMPTTMHGFGAAAMAVAPETAPTTPTPAPTPGVKPVFNRLAVMTALAPRANMAVMAPSTSTAVPDATVPGVMPGMTLPLTAHPPGSITAFDPAINRWRVAFPPTAGFGMFSAPGVFIEQASLLAPDPSDTQVPLKDFQAKLGQTPFYKKPLFWVAVAGGVVVVGGGSYFLLRKRRTA